MRSKIVFFFQPNYTTGAGRGYEMGQPIVNGAVYYHNGIPYTYQVRQLHWLKKFKLKYYNFFHFCGSVKIGKKSTNIFLNAFIDFKMFLKLKM